MPRVDTSSSCASVELSTVLGSMNCRQRSAGSRKIEAAASQWKRVKDSSGSMLPSRISSSVAGTDEDELILLGSIDPDESFTRFHWDGAASIFLEPALRWRRWADPSTPASSTLAHELLITSKGQVSFGDRLIPQFQHIAGGLFTVRGYDQALTAGDTVLIGSAEYRLHVPRLLYPSPDAPHVPVLGKVKIRPENVYGRPDWDFVLKAFVDAARVIVEDRQDFESNETLIGIGVGAELLFMRNLSARVDFGWPQRTPDFEDTDSPEIHTAITVSF